MEAAISSSLAHPNIVATYTYFIKAMRDSGYDDALLQNYILVKCVALGRGGEGRGGNCPGYSLGYIHIPVHIARG